MKRIFELIRSIFIGICISAVIFIFFKPYGAIFVYSSIYLVSIICVILWDKISGHNFANKFNAKDLNTNEIFLRKYHLFFSNSESAYQVGITLSIFRAFSLLIFGPLCIFKGFPIIGGIHILISFLLTPLFTKLQPLDSHPHHSAISSKIKDISQRINDSKKK